MTDIIKNVETVDSNDLLEYLTLLPVWRFDKTSRRFADSSVVSIRSNVRPTANADPDGLNWCYIRFIELQWMYASIRVLLCAEEKPA